MEIYTKIKSNQKQEYKKDNPINKSQNVFSLEDKTENKASIFLNSEISYSTINYNDIEHPRDKAGDSTNNIDDATKDGVIENTKQGKRGDCWLLSGINSLSYTEAGSETIKNALTYHDGYTTVHLATGDYIVSDSTVAATKEISQYSSGDDDMIILELAVEQALDEAGKGIIKFDEFTPGGLGYNEIKISSNDTSSIDSGNSGVLWFLLTGKNSEIYNGSDKEKTLSILDEFRLNNGKDIAVTFSTPSAFNENRDLKIYNKFGGYYIIDTNGDDHLLIENHEYAIKSADNDNVTIVNPWNSSKEFTITREQYLGMCNHVMKIDLSDKKVSSQYITYNIADSNGKALNCNYRSVTYNDDGTRTVIYNGKDEFGNDTIGYDENGDGLLEDIIEID